MPEALSLDLRRRIVAAYKRGEGTYAEIAALFSVGEASVSRLLSLERATGEVSPRPHGGGAPAKIDDDELDALRALVRRKPDATRAELCAVWRQERGVKLSVSTMGRALRAAGLSRKKSSSARSRRTDRTSSKGARRSRSG